MGTTMRGTVVIIFQLLCSSSTVFSATPIVTWHGVGGTAAECNSLIDTIKLSLPDVHVLNVAVGPDPDMDHANSVLMRCVDQIDMICQQLLDDPLMAEGYNAVGISQGCLLIRGLTQRCPVPVKNLITFGAPHQGVFGVPDCEIATGSYELCVLVRELLSAGAYEPWIQDLVAPAQYWNDPLNHTNYVTGSHYLGVINNEREEKNQDYKDRMLQLENFVMLMWENDTTVIPKETSHFETYVPGQEREVLPLRESALYQEDYIGLKTLDEQGKLHFYSVPGHHVQFDYAWVAENIIPFLM